MTIIGYLSALLTGVILGAIGGGGSILTVPILVYLMGIEATTATSYSLFIVGIASATGCAQHVKRRQVNWSVVGAFGLPAVAAIFAVRRFLFGHVPERIMFGDLFVSRHQVVLLFLAFLLFICGLLMLRQNERRLPDVATDTDLGRKPLATLVFAVRGLATGVVTGFVGVGGGFLIVPALSVSTSLDFKAIVGTSLAIIAINSLLGFAFDHMHGHIVNLDWVLISSFCGLTVAGAALGSVWSYRVSTSMLRRIFAFLLIVVALGIFCTEGFLLWRH